MNKLWYAVKLGHSRVTFVALVDKSRTNISMLTGNAAYTTPNPTLASFATAADALDTAVQAYDFSRSRLDKQDRDQAFVALKAMRADLGAYVQTTSGGDATLITSAGFEMEAGRQPLGLLNAPQNVRAVSTAYPGKVELRFNGVKGRLVYEVSICAGDPKVEADWSLYTTTGKNRVSFTGLNSGKEYFFRVVALGAAGASPLSDVANAKAA
ncbi:MAG: fibronectin type III domain-containing protein [Flavobacteriales bacterium]|nr:fibronectin type III domain-containing protein [Flavobacteriales bacterium]MBK9533875.1 fibronectin type III domain-containing protein [Flavobacteriales bacterium]HQX31543.1 fibronectin type III domain-containing protein [Flavobacteriales bacterium]